VSTRPRSRATRAGCAPMRRAVAHATRVRAPRRCETCSCPPGVSCYARTGQPPPRACGRAVADAAVEAVLTLSTGAERGVRTAYSAGGMTSRQGAVLRALPACHARRCWARCAGLDGAAATDSQPPVLDERQVRRRDRRAGQPDRCHLSACQIGPWWRAERPRFPSAKRSRPLRHCKERL
jgi:hypothetical protein